jgi:hypothetical protein
MTGSHEDTRDRVIRQGEQINQLEKKVDELLNLVSEMRDSMLHAKGAWMTILALASVAGFIAGQLTNIMAWFGHK